MKSQNTCLTNLDNAHTDITNVLGELLKAEFGEKVSSITKLSGGINCEAFKVTTDKNKAYFAKKYNRRKGDNRNRLSTEFSGLSFLWANGIRNVPEPLLSCEQFDVAIYKFINGVKILPGRITRGDIDEAADFATRLHSLIESRGAEIQPIASEACFSSQSYIDCVESRVDRLKKIILKGCIFDSLRAYLENEFIPFFNVLKKSVIQKNKASGPGINRLLPIGERTLSASDFGFHNAIKIEDGKLFFVDFEYYGWDDPVKMIADFYLQPAVQVPVEYREYFFKKVRSNYQEGVELERRLSMIYPILGLKWCLIILNIFFRVDDGEAKEEICFEHLDKSIKKFKEIKNEVAINAFPIILE